jgi:hypothetical protein
MMGIQLFLATGTFSILIAFSNWRGHKKFSCGLQVVVGLLLLGRGAGLI